MTKTMALCVLTLSAAASAQTTYRIVEQGASNCAVSGINDSSDVAGQCNSGATVWRGGIATSLGKLPNGMYSVVQSINSRGVAVGAHVPQWRCHRYRLQCGQCVCHSHQRSRRDCRQLSQGLRDVQ